METILEQSKNIVDKLEYKELKKLSNFVNEKLLEYKQNQILKDTEIAIQDYKNGKYRSSSVEELISELEKL